MAESIKIAGNTYWDVPEIVVPSWDGVETSSFYALTPGLEWMGPYMVPEGQWYEADYTLNNTDFNGWIPSTTAKTIIASVNVSPVFKANMEEYSYWIRWDMDVNVTYDGTQDGKAQLNRYCASQWQNLQRRSYGISGFQQKTHTQNYCVSAYSASTYTFYNNTSGTSTWTSGISYGIYMGLTAATFSSSTGASPNVTLKTPVVSARCSTTYFKTANAGKVDQQHTTLRIRANIFRVPAIISPIRGMYDAVVDIYNDPIPPLEE